VVYKPPGWECDIGVSTATQTDNRLSTYLRAMLSPRAELNPIIRDALYDFGMVHRLDVPSSGLILVGKTYEAYLDLRLQLNAGMVERDYVVLVHNQVPPSLRTIDAPLSWVSRSRLPTRVDRQGRPSRTRIKLLAHLNDDEEDYSLLAVRIDTGRQHQIRAHLAHFGFPVVCDQKYGSSHFQADLEWCPRNFLHRYRLAFQAQDGSLQSVTDPLPDDLRGSLATLEPMDDASEEAAMPWLKARDWWASSVNSSSTSASSSTEASSTDLRSCHGPSSSSSVSSSSSDLRPVPPNSTWRKNRVVPGWEAASGSEGQEEGHLHSMHHLVKSVNSSSPEQADSTPTFDERANLPSWEELEVLRS